MADITVALIGVPHRAILRDGGVVGEVSRAGDDVLHNGGRHGWTRDTGESRNQPGLEQHSLA